MTYSAASYTSQTSQYTFQKTKDGINTIGEYYGLLRAIYRTVSGKGKVIDLTDHTPLPFPDSWVKHTIKAGGQNVIYCEANVPNAIGTYIFAMGHGTESTYYKPWIDRANKLGFNVITVELPVPENNEFFANGDLINIGYKKIIGDTILNPDSPIFKNIPNTHPISIITHSASGQAFEINVKDDVEKANFAKRFFKIFHTGIMLDTANSSVNHYPIASFLYRHILSTLKHVHDKKLGSTEMDRYWLRHELDVDSRDYMVGVQSNPTHGQARCLKEAGMAHTEAVHERKGLTAEFVTLKRTILMGADETGACPLTAEGYANDVHGIDFVLLENTKHNPLMECSRGYSIISKQTVPHARRMAQAAAAASP